MVERTVIIKNATGLDLAPAGILCNVAMQFVSSVTFSYEGGSANAKSILSILGSTLSCGDAITLHCEGADEEEAIATLSELIDSDFSE